MTHSWLITGPPGSGRSNLAYAFAAALLSPATRRATRRPMRQVAARTHPDLGVLSTERVIITIDEVRKLVASSPVLAVGRPLPRDGHRRRRPHDRAHLERAAQGARGAAAAHGVDPVRAERGRPASPPSARACAPCGCGFRRRRRRRADLAPRRRRPARSPTRAAREAQSHIGMAHRLATNDEARDAARRRRCETGARHPLGLGCRDRRGRRCSSSPATDAKAITEERDAEERESALRSLGIEPGGTIPPGAARPAEGARGGPEAPRHPQPARRHRPHPGRPAVAVPRHPAAAARASTLEPINLEHLLASCCRGRRAVTPAATLATLDAIATARAPHRGQRAPRARPRGDARHRRHADYGRSARTERGRDECAHSPADRRGRSPRSPSLAAAQRLRVVRSCRRRRRATSTPTSEKVAAELQPFYSQVLTWTSCGERHAVHDRDGAAGLERPGAGDRSSSRSSASRRPGTRLGSLLVNPGGPGGSGYDFVRDSLDYAIERAPAGELRHRRLRPARRRPLDRGHLLRRPDGARRVPLRHLAGPARLRRVDRRRRGRRTPSSAQACLEEHRRAARLRRHRERRARPRPAARDARRQEAQLPRLLVRHASSARPTPSCSRRRPGRLVLDGALDPATSDFDVTDDPGEGLRERAAGLPRPTASRRNDCPFRGTVDDGDGARSRDLLDALDASPLTRSRRRAARREHDVHRDHPAALQRRRTGRTSTQLFDRRA